MPLFALILAGGASRRMGRDKLRLAWSGSASGTVLEHVVDVALSVADEVRVVAPLDGEPLLPADYLRRVDYVRDADKHRGPLQALAHAWPETDGAQVLVVAGDYPGVTADVLQACKRELDKATAALDGVVVCSGGFVQPLLGCYRVEAGRALRDAVKLGEHRLMATVDKLSLQCIQAEQWPAWWTKPIHTPADYVAWLERVEASQ